MKKWFSSIFTKSPPVLIPRKQDVYYPLNRRFAKYRDPIDVESANKNKVFNPENLSQFDLESDKSGQVSVNLPGLPIITYPRNNSTSTESLLSVPSNHSRLPPTPAPSSPPSSNSSSTSRSRSLTRVNVEKGPEARKRNQVRSSSSVFKRHICQRPSRIQF